MKKLIAFSLALLLAIGLAACNSPAEPNEPSEEPEGNPEAEALTLRIGGMTGPTGIGLAPLMQKSGANETVNEYAFTIAGAADALTPQLIQGELDLAAIPANLAAILHQQTEGEIQVLAVNTLGVLYIVSTGEEEISSIADLAGKTIYATGKGSTPEYTLRYLLTENGLDPDTDVDLQFKSEPTEVVSLLAQGGGIAMLPQPYVTAAQNQVEGLEMVLDLTAEWNALEADSTLITGVMVVRKSFAEANPDAIAQFLADYEASIKFAAENVAETAALCGQYEIVAAPVAEKAIPYCNLTFLSGEEMKSALGGYLEVLYAQNPKAVGEAVPTDAFYYVP